MTTLVKSSDRISFCNAIIKTTEILQNEVNRGHVTGGMIKPGLVQMEIPENLAIVGDLHGDLESLERLLEEIDSKEFLSNPHNKIIFLGDYVDRGSHSIEVLQMLCDLKIRYQESVILMRGNHEAPSEFPFSSHDFPVRLGERFGEEWRSAYDKVLDLFKSLALVTVIGKNLFLVHGGPATGFDNQYERTVANAAECCIGSTTLEELLWNDPRPLKNGVGYEKSRRLFGKHFGLKISKNCLEVTNTRVIVRSHEPCQQFRIDHENRVMTIFSCGESYPKFEPSHIFIRGNQLEQIRNAVDLVPFVRKIKRGR